MRKIKKKLFTEEDKSNILNLYNKERFSIHKIGEVYNVSDSTIQKILKSLGYSPRTNREQALKYSFNEKYFDTIDSENKAYWLGYICADGTIYKKDTQNSGTLKIETKLDDKELVEKFRTDIGSNHNIKIYGNKYFPGYKSARLVLKSNHLIETLDKYGISACKSLTISFPSLMEKNIYCNAFIRGYFDGDGSICLYKTGIFDIKIAGTKQFLEKIREITNIKARISLPKSKIYELRISSNLEREKFLSYIYKDSTIYLNRKYKRYQQFLKKYNS